jgi:excisionase family DNA binding protein
MNPHGTLWIAMYERKEDGMLMVDERWLTVEQIADALQVHANTVRRWLRSGELTGHNLGGKAGYRVRERDFEAFLDARYERPDIRRDEEAQ